MARRVGKGISRRTVLTGIAGVTAGLFAPAIISSVRAGEGKIDLGGYVGPELSSEPITLRFLRQDFTPAVNTLLEQAYAEFTAQYPNITISEEKVPYGDLQKKQLVYMMSNDAPDIMIGRTDFSEAYHYSSAALPLQDYLSADYIADIPQNLRDAASAGGNLYCAPWETTIMMMYFNRDIFDRVGMETPPEIDTVEGGWTNEDFIERLDELGARLRAAGDTNTWAFAASSQGNGGPGSNYSQFESIWTRGQGDPAAPKDSTAYRTLAAVSEDGLKVSGSIDTPEAIKGMQLYQSLFTRGITPTGPVRNQYPGGLAATYLGGLLFANRFRIPGQEPEFKWGASMPPKGKILFSNNTSDAPLIWSKTRHPAEAAALLAFLCNDANRLAFHRAWGSMPSRTSLVKAMEEFETEQPFRIAAALLENSYGAPRTPGAFDYFNAMNPVIKDIALGADPAQALPDAAAKIDRLLAKYK